MIGERDKEVHGSSARSWEWGCRRRLEGIAEDEVVGAKRNSKQRIAVKRWSAFAEERNRIRV